MSLKRVVLHLARTKDFPQGSSEHGYEFIAPISADGHLDAEAWKHHRESCRVRRFWLHEDDEVGHLVHRPGGSWAFRYDVAGNDDDEAGYRFGAHTFHVGEYISLKDEDGDMLTYTVASVTSV